MNQAETSRELGRLGAQVEGVVSRLDHEERGNETAHREIKVSVEVSHQDVMKRIDDMHEALGKRLTSIEDTVSISKAWFRAVKLVAYILGAVLLLKFGDARDMLKELWKTLF